MSMSRLEWIDLPAPARHAIEARIGTVTRTETAGAGINSAIATTLHTDSGRVFVKGIALDHAQVDEQQRDVEITPYVLDVAPRLLWQVESAGWSLLGYEYIDGRRADYRPGSPDFPLLADAVRRLHKIPCPDVPHLLRLEQRLADFWQGAAPGMSHIVKHRILCLEGYTDRETARRCYLTWSGLSAAAHHRAYELPPHPAEIRVRRPDSGPVLSPREMDVLRLIAQGKTDREIADELFISRHTVMRHVSHILAKLEVESRSAAAASAVRLGLV
jgi:DNA-binding CsgD family transcriptional regulator